MCKNIYSRSFHSSLKIQTKREPTYWVKAKQIVLYQCNRILLCHKNDEINNFRRN